MQDIGTRFLIAMGIVWLGFNLIALGMTENGSNHRWNPMWQFMSGFLDIEWMVMKGILIVALIGFAIFIGIRVISLVNEVKAEMIEESKSKYNETFRSNINDHTYAVTAKPRETSEPKKEPLMFYEVPMSVRAPEEPKPIPRALTPEELKQKAIIKSWEENNHDSTNQRPRNFIQSFKIRNPIERTSRRIIL